MKSIVVKLSGFAKFELDTKLNCGDLNKIIEHLSTGEEGFQQEQFETFCGVFERTFSMEEPFKGDLENETYKAILAAFREVKFE